MNDRDERVPLPGEPGHSGSFDDDLGGAIAAALAPLAPEPEEFAAGVRERVARGEAAGDAKASGPLRFSSWLRSAAAFLPPFLLPRELAEAGLVAGGLALKKSAWKLVPGVVAFPAIALVTVVATFFFSAQRSGARGEQTTHANEAQREVMDWWRRHWIATFASLAGLLYLGWRAPIEAVTLFVALSMLALVGVYGSLARAGLATREEVGKRAGQFQMMLLAWGFQLVSFAPSGGLPGWVRLVAPALLIVGGLACFALAFRDRGKEARGGWMASRVERVGLVMALTPLFLLLVAALVFLGVNSKRRASVADARSFVEGGFADGDGAPDLGGAAAAVHHLDRAGGPPVDRSALREAAHARMDDARRSSDLPNLLSVWSLDELGLLRDEDLLLYRNEYKEAQLTKSDRPLTGVEHDYVAVVTRLRLAGEDGVVGLTDAGRRHVAERVLAGVDEGPGHGDLEELWCRVRLLEELGHGGRVAELAPVVRETLVATWTGAPGFAEGAFAPGPNLVKRDDDGARVESRLTFVWLDATDHALRLIGRFGAPPEVDLAQLAAYLDEQAVHHGGKLDDRHALAAAARAHVRELRGPEVEDERRPWRTLVELRGTIAIGLLAALCVLVTLRAPKGAAVDPARS